MTHRLRSGLLFALTCPLGFVALTGCTDKSKPTTAGKSANLDPILGPVQAGRKASQRIVTANELRNIHLFINSAIDVPSKEQIIAAMKQEDPKAYQLIQDGAIVLTGARSREAVWAYEKDAPTNGGWAVVSSGPDRMTAAQLQQLLSQQN
jgi:hypothetical protein